MDKIRLLLSFVLLNCQFKMYGTKEINKAISFFGEKAYFTKRDFIILYTALFGDSPDENEITVIYKNNEFVKQEEVKKFFYHKAKCVSDTELYILELFRALDENVKCYITAEDVVHAWKVTKIPFSIKLLMECFSLITENNLLDYFSFRDIYLKFNK